MCFPTVHVLDFTPEGLFPYIHRPRKNAKCLVITDIVQQLATCLNGKELTQEILQNQATRLYLNLIKVDKIPLAEAKYKIALFCEKGIFFDLAKEYYSFQVKDTDIKHLKAFNKGVLRP